MSETTITVLSPGQANHLAYLEGIVKTSLGGFKAAGDALAEIRDLGLWAGYPSFKAYLAGKWGISEQHGYRLIDAASVTEGLTNWLAADVPLPATESQARALSVVPEAERADVWQESVSRSGGQPASARVVQEVAAERVDALSTEGQRQAAATFMADHRARVAARENTPTLDKGPAMVAQPEAQPEEADSPSHDEWYTRPEHIAAVHEVMGGIDLDPASCARANTTVRARGYFTKEDDGLIQQWLAKRLFLNPPYLRLIAPFVAKLLASFGTGDVGEAILLVNANTGSAWFEALFDYPVCLVKGRIRYEDGTKDASEKPAPARADSAFVYLGPNVARFVEVFSKFGTVVRRVEP